MRRIIGWIVVMGCLFYGAVVAYFQHNVMHPKKRLLQPYHHSWLNTPHKHSMKIVPLQTSTGTPYLLVEHDTGVDLSKRAFRLKQELISLGYHQKELSDNGLIVMFHGKNGRKEDLLPVAERYTAAGFRAVLVDLPGHGDNPHPLRYYGQYEESFLKEEVLQDLQDRNRLKTQESVYLWGMSLGGAFAISNGEVLKTHFPPKGIILVATFDKLSFVLKEKSLKLFGNFFGKIFYKGLALSLQTLYGLDPESVDSATRAQHIKLPVFVFHGKQDGLIRWQRGKELFDQIKSRTKRWVVDEKGNHQNILITNYPFYAESIDFLLKNAAKAASRAELPAIKQNRLRDRYALCEGNMRYT